MKTRPTQSFRLARHWLASTLAAACAFGPLAAPAQAAPTGANLPQLGDSASADLSPVLERKLGEQIMLDIRRNPDYLDDAAISEYLNNFGAGLVAAAPGARGEANIEFQFFAVRDPMLNAFALPGGFIGVHSALLTTAQTESELAGVLSHEIGHVAQRHIARQIGQQKQDALIPLASMILAALAARASPDAAVGVFMGGQGLAIQRQLDFSRAAEREADRIGFQIMGSAGFDTSGMVAFFGRMQTATRGYSDSTPAYLRTHPLTSERISDIRARIRETPYKQRPDSLDFHLVRARARVLQDMSVSGLADTEAAFTAQAKSDNRQHRAAGHYGLAMVALHRGQLAKAQSWLDKAIADSHVPVKAGVFTAAPASSGDGGSVLAGLGLEILLAPGQPKDVGASAVKAAEQAHSRFPLSRGIARQYAEAMIANGQLDEATRFLRDQARQYREEPKLHEMLAKTYAAQGKIALQHMSLAESYALSGGVLAALDQLTLARKASDASFYDLAVIDARERELKAKRREELGEEQAEKEKEEERERRSESRRGSASRFGAPY